jgi:hypothetical protein
MSTSLITRTVTVQKWVGDPHRSGTIEVTLDLDSIARQLAQKAFFSKGKKSRSMGGAIVGKAHSVQEVPK